ncbi:MAG TPA: hypothetical protein VFD36_20460 [Kofleriaceae bacterium]|nr:hypothetical protein [Kofleriaceae bacterium]
MAFSGQAVIKQISETAFRITGLSLAGAQSGTIGFGDKSVAADVSLPDLPDWKPFKAFGAVVSLQEAVKVTWKLASDVSTAVPVSMVKSGTKHSDFAITLHNDNAAEGGDATPDLEILIEWAGR